MKSSFIKTIAVKHLLKTGALLFCLATVVSCKKTPDAIPPADPVTVNSISDFEFVQDPADAFKFSFKNLSTKYKRVEWRFGDDTLTTEINPTHIYTATGKFSVILRTISETGSASQKLVDINIKPDSVIRITTAKTGVPNQIKFGITTKSPVASVLWTFNDSKPAVTSTDLNPVRTYVPGAFNTVTVQITTTNGSVATLTTNNATTEGLMQEITAARDNYTTSAENILNTNENSPKLLDGNMETKYTMGGKDGRLFTYPLIITLNYSTPQAVKSYCIGSSNDNPPRDPKTWSVQGSNDGVTWETLDTRAMTKNFYDQMTALGAINDTQRYKQLFFYNIATPKAFTKYRWVINSNFGDAAMQVNEFKLYK
ncbi:MAG: PKD domain-containing protein [Bacteroidota bacterium]